MTLPRLRHPILVVAAAEERAAIRTVLQANGCSDWQLEEAAAPAQARFLVQHDGCDAVVVAEPAGAGGTEILQWLMSQDQVPLVILSDEELPRPRGSCGRHYLPRSLALAHPVLLREAVAGAICWRDLRRSLSRATAEAEESRRQARCLTGLLWEAVPMAGRAHWLTQRHMMERLQQESVRAERYRTPLSVALAEILGGPQRDNEAVRAAVISSLVRGTRRCDVAGQYGPHGLMLLMPGSGSDGAATCCRRLQQLVRGGRLQRELADSASLRLPFGVASYVPGETGPESLLSRAEQCLESARRSPDRPVVC